MKIPVKVSHTNAIQLESLERVEPQQARRILIGAVNGVRDALPAIVAQIDLKVWPEDGMLHIRGEAIGVADFGWAL